MPFSANSACVTAGSRDIAACANRLPVVTLASSLIGRFHEGVRRVRAAVAFSVLLGLLGLGINYTRVANSIDIIRGTYIW